MLDCNAADTCGSEGTLRIQACFNIAEIDITTCGSAHYGSKSIPKNAAAASKRKNFRVLSELTILLHRSDRTMTRARSSRLTLTESAHTPHLSGTAESHF